MSWSHSICAVLVMLFFSNTALGIVETSASFEQTSFGGDPPIDDSSGPAPLPAAFVQGGSDSTDYTVEATADISSPTSLRTTAFLAVSAISDDIPNNWQTLNANARAESSLVDFAIVQGVPGEPSGFVEFFWIVTGDTRLVLENAENVDISNYLALTTLQSTIPGVGLLLSEVQTLPTGATDIDQTFPTSSSVVSIPVPWQAGQEIPVFFDLLSTVQIEATNTDFGGFFAELAAEFGNTAELDGVRILDSAGNPLPDATLVSTSGFVYPTAQPAAVPEPSAIALALLGLAVLLAVARGRARMF